MKKNKRIIVSASCLLLCLSTGYVWHKSHQRAEHLTNHGSHPLSQDAMVAIINNDQAAFEKFIAKGGDLQSSLPMYEGKTLTVAEGLAHFERVTFIKHLQDKKIPFVNQNKYGSLDIVALAVARNNPELLKAIMMEKPDMTVKYGEKKQNLLHIASAVCSDKVASLLHETGKFKVSDKQHDGASAMTLAAESKCVPMLTIWKENNKAEFNHKDGQGKTALSILKKATNDAAVSAFMSTFDQVRKPASVAALKPAKPVDYSFYKKRIIPKDELADHRLLVDPEIRPLDAEETSEFSEFSD